MKINDKAKVDPIFSEPRLAAIYDVFDSERDDIPPYVSLIKSLDAKDIIDLGCGTGSLSLVLADEGLNVLGVDPAAASIDVARLKTGADKVQWLTGDASVLPVGQADVVVMIGNTAQAITTVNEWGNTLVKAKAALKRGGYFIFETRDPSFKAWKDWNKESSFKSVVLENGERIDGWVETTAIELPRVSFKWTYYFYSDGATLASDSTLIFRTLEEIQDDLDKYGFEYIEARDAPDRPNKEFVVIAKLP